MGSTSGVDEEENKRMSKVKRLDPVPESKRKKKREDRDKGKVWRRKKEKKKKRNVWIKKIREKKNKEEEIKIEKCHYNIFIINFKLWVVTN